MLSDTGVQPELRAPGMEWEGNRGQSPARQALDGCERQNLHGDRGLSLIPSFLSSYSEVSVPSTHDSFSMV